MSCIEGRSSRGMDAAKLELFLPLFLGQTINFSSLVCYQVCSYTITFSENINPGDLSGIVDLGKKKKEYFTSLQHVISSVQVLFYTAEQGKKKKAPLYYSRKVLFKVCECFFNAVNDIFNIFKCWEYLLQQGPAELEAAITHDTYLYFYIPPLNGGLQKIAIRSQCSEQLRQANAEKHTWFWICIKSSHKDTFFWNFLPP